jgi:phosphotriesterase-related protein
VQVVSGIAFYDQSTYPEWVRSASVEAIADYFVRLLEEGEHGVRAGLIGEVMSHNEPVANAAGYRLEPLEHRVFVAAAQAQRRTGAAISTHASLGRAGPAQLDVFERSGADLSRVVIGHCDAHVHDDIALDLAYYLPILQRGAYCQFDMIGWNAGTRRSARRAHCRARPAWTCAEDHALDRYLPPVAIPAQRGAGLRLPVDLVSAGGCGGGVSPTSKSG